MRKAQKTKTSKRKVPKSDVRMESIRMPVEEAMQIVREMEHGIVRDARLCYIVTLKLGRWGTSWRKQAEKFRKKFGLRQSEFDG